MTINRLVISSLLFRRSKFVDGASNFSSPHSRLFAFERRASAISDLHCRFVDTLYLRLPGIRYVTNIPRFFAIQSMYFLKIDIRIQMCWQWGRMLGTPKHANVVEIFLFFRLSEFFSWNTSYDAVGGKQQEISKECEICHDIWVQLELSSNLKEVEFR